jgi:hypothetical protein
MSQDLCLGGQYDVLIGSGFELGESSRRGSHAIQGRKRSWGYGITERQGMMEIKYRKIERSFKFDLEPNQTSLPLAEPLPHHQASQRPVLVRMRAFSSALYCPFQISRMFSRATSSSASLFSESHNKGTRVC